jgi:uncharacterized circularly permuted ATP-grasp superfamily protein
MNGEAPDWLSGYDAGGYYCEVFGRPDAPALHTLPLRERLGRIPIDELRRRARNAENELYNLGVTFTVYSDKDVIDRILPFDVIPRVLSAEEWRHIEAGVVQRVTALNLFLHDVYHRQLVLKDGIVPRELVLGNANYRPEMVGFDVPCGTYIHICGVDIVRDDSGRFMVLEDNGRTPSGVSYVVENRRIMQRAFPDLIDVFIQPVEDYGLRLGQAMTEIAPSAIDAPQVALLSPGVYNSAYFEHAFLAREMGVPLVEGRDLVVENDRVFMKTTAGLAPLHVIYRRIDDDFIDPLTFRADTSLGVPGLFNAYRAGNIALANAIGTGIADDKALYAYVPAIIRYYLDEDAILPNVETYLLSDDSQRSYVLDHLDELVVKAVGESGGYGMLIGPHSTATEREEFRQRIKADPRNYIAQPTLALSRAPCFIEGQVEPRCVDLRPYILYGDRVTIVPGGLTRVALRRGSLVVNSSQGGGSKDTWVLY